MVRHRVPFMDLALQDQLVVETAKDALTDIVMRSDFVLGDAVSEFETEFAQYVGCQNVVGLSSGTEALVLAMRALGAGPGTEVIVPAFGFVATAEAVVLAGAEPVLADVDPRTLTIDVASVARMISARTRAIIAVHLYGNPADLGSLCAIADRHGVPLIEDAAQAHGTRYDGRRIGTFGRISCFSFYPTKNLGAWGDAGAVATDDDKLADQVRCLRHHGQVGKHDHIAVGTTARLDSLQAVVLRLKLPHLDRWVEERQALGFRYATMLPKDVISTQTLRGSEPAWHLYVIRHSARAALAAWLDDRGVETAVHYPYAVSDLPPYQGFRRDGECPQARLAGQTVLSLPLYPGLSRDSVDFVAESVCEWLSATL